MFLLSLKQNAQIVCIRTAGVLSHQILRTEVLRRMVDSVDDGIEIQSRERTRYASLLEYHQTLSRRKTKHKLD